MTDPTTVTAVVVIASAIAGCQALAVGAVWAYEWIRNRYARPHECDLVAVAVDHDRSFGAALGGGRQDTTVLWRCRWCSHAESSTIDGVFTLAQIRAWGAVPMPLDWEPPREPVAALTTGPSS